LLRRGNPYFFPLSGAGDSALAASDLSTAVDLELRMIFGSRDSAPAATDLATFVVLGLPRDSAAREAAFRPVRSTMSITFLPVSP
jgi:hypothetical protein